MTQMTIESIRAAILQIILAENLEVHETMLEVISRGDQPGDIFGYFNMSIPDYPDSYIPPSGDDPWIWETIEDHADKEATKLREELEKDEKFAQQMDEHANWWYVVFGHRCPASDDAPPEWGLIFGFEPLEN
jgi:hypothetical protein